MIKYAYLTPLLFTFAACDSDASRAIEIEAPDTGVALEVDELFSSGCTGNNTPSDPGFVVIRTPAELNLQLENSVWYTGEGAGASELEQLPEVNFETHVVLAAYLGPYRCVEDVSISSVVETANEVRATVLIAPCEQGDLESSPYVFAKVPRINKPYVKVEQLSSCD